ncbi:MAG: type IV secretion system DNA-binding domain-containing protein [Firmicutes bacterium]|nr:type IV secretion system DNA-binding domain-containing protein [Bacillota bacterium]
MVKRKFEEICWREVVWHRPFKLETVWELLSHLAALSPRGAVIWEARGCGGYVHYYLGADQKHITKLEETCQAHGNIQFYDVPERNRKPVSTARRLKITHPMLSLKTDISMLVIRAGLAAMAAVQGDDETVLQIVLGGAYAPSPVPANLPDPNASWLQAVLGNVGKASPESRSSAKEKAGQHGFQTVIRLGVSGDAPNGRIASIHSALKVLESAGVRIYTEVEKPARINLAHVPWHWPLKLSVKELVNFLLLPVGEEELAGANGLHPQLLLPPTWYKEPRAWAERTFAYSMNGLKQQRLSISPKDSLEHTLLLGPTGSGKSTAMLHLILADIKAGRSVLVIDPKADLVHSILERVPESRADEVVVIDPSDPCPVGFNPFAFRNYKNRELIADAVLAVFKDIFAENWGIRSQDILSGALLTLAKTEGASLLWLPTLLTDEAFRQKITSNLTDKIGLKPFWEHFEAMRDSVRRQEIAPVMNKVRQFLFRPGLRNVLGQSSPKFDLTDLFHHRRIVLVPLNRGVIGTESARLLGSLIVGLTWTLALSRANITPERRHIINVYIDELQDYLSLPTDLSDALAQARGLGVALTLAHQYREQLPPQIRAGADANARNKITFGLNSADAKDMAAMAPGLSALDFMTLPRYQIYASFQQDGKNTGWIQGKTMPAPPAIQTAAELKARSMSKYGKPTEEVEAEYLETLTTDSPSDIDLENVSVGRRKKP